MNTKHVLMLACASLVLYAIAFSRSATDDSNTLPSGANFRSERVEIVEPIVVKPSSATFDLEAVSPAELPEATADEQVMSAVDISTSRLTWYDPKRLEEVAGTS